MRDNKNMIKRKLIIIGDVGAGKTSLLSALKCEDDTADESQVKKTQSLIYDTHTIDTPGEYMQNPSMYKYIIAEAQGVEFVIFVQDASSKKSIYPYGFASSFNTMTIGVITKTDAPDADIEKSRQILKNLVLKGPVFETSSRNGKGIQALREFIQSK